MKIFSEIFKWIFIILFFPMSLVFVAYFKRQKVKRDYFAGEEE